MPLPHVDADEIDFVRNEMRNNIFEHFKRFQNDNPMLFERMLSAVGEDLDEIVLTETFLLMIVGIYTCLRIAAERHSTSLPVVTFDSIEDVCKGANTSSDQAMHFIGDNLYKENKELLAYINSVLDKAKNQQEKDILATVAGLMYSSLDAQQTIDEIDTQFSTP